MISDVRTIAFLAVLAALFYLIHVLYHKKHMDFAAVVMVGTGLGLVLGLAIQFVAGFPDKPMEVAFVAETTTWFAMFGSGYSNPDQDDRCPARHDLHHAGDHQHAAGPAAWRSS